MKTLLAILVLSMSLNAFANETREYKKLSATEASVEIKTNETDYTQAAIYNDGKENEKFIAELLKDGESPLYELARKIELENCETNSTTATPYIEGCGEVTVTSAIKTSFARGGWQNSNAGYSFFIGFTNAGTGRFFGVTHMITINEEADASTKEETGEYSGTVVKTLSLGKILKITDETTENSN
jgi:hypothetical protein